jgi:hypothetical protein
MFPIPIAPALESEANVTHLRYAYDLKVPAWVIDSEAMQSIFRETVISVVMYVGCPRLCRALAYIRSANDIFSFKKEAVSGRTLLVIMLY